MKATNANSSRFATRWPLRQCLIFGVSMGAVYAVLQTAVASNMVDFTEEYGFPLPVAVALDFAAGGLGGLIAGLLIPLVRGSIGAAAVGAATIFPAVFAFGAAENGLSADLIVTAAIASVLIGSMLGVFIWKRYGP